MAIADHSCVAVGSAGNGDYRPRNPEDSLLYRTIADHLETFLARQRQRGRDVPQFIERDLREYLSCGILACGFLRLKYSANSANRPVIPRNTRLRAELSTNQTCQQCTSS